ncbi:MAG: hypothetical protein NVSMB1_03320 [Polyangiales bacterium]
MSQIFAGLPGFRHLISYWYHFAIMFEALFILTTVDTGTRVARFLVQEFLGRILVRPQGAAPANSTRVEGPAPIASEPALHKFAQTDWLPGTIISTTLVCLGWGYFVWTGQIATIWPMLGISNQLLACIALCAGTTMIIHSGRARYAWVTLTPLVFVGVATQTAGYELITETFLPKMVHGGKVFQGWLNIAICALAMAAMIFIFLQAFAKWTRSIRTPERRAVQAVT